MVSTLRKSYSLSDLSEPDMQQSHDEVDEMMFGRGNHLVQYRHMQPINQRYITKARVQNPTYNYNGMHRSSSTSRSVDVYYDDSMRRRSDNYE